MLEKILEKTGLSPGAIRVASWLFGVNGGTAVCLTIEKMAANAGCEKRALLDAVRSGKTKPGAISQLVEAGVPIHLVGGNVVFDGTAQPIPPVRSSASEASASECVQVESANVTAPISEAERERRQLRKSGVFADCVQLSFDQMDATVARVSSCRPDACIHRLPTMQTAALRLPKAPVARSLCNDCATSAQPLHDDCTTVAQSALSDVQKALFDRIQQRLSEKPAVSDPKIEKKSPVSPIPINHINKPINTIPIPIPIAKPIESLPTQEETEPKSAGAFSPARYVEFLDVTKERFPGWKRQIKNPRTGHSSNCGWAVDRLARMMGWGAPQDVFEQVIEFVASSNPHVRARNPSAAFLWKVKELSKIWRYE